jgi:hypothetical protein
MEGRRACRIAIYRSASIEDAEASLEQYHRWAIERMLQFKKVFGPRLPSAAHPADASIQDGGLIVTESDEQ